MTKKEKQTIKSLLLKWNFASYEGNIKLNEFFEKYSELVGIEKINTSEKIGMKFTNMFFPHFLEAWKTERKYLFGYYNSLSSAKHNLYGFDNVNTILEKYYKS